MDIAWTLRLWILAYSAQCRKKRRRSKGRVSSNTILEIGLARAVVLDTGNQHDMSVGEVA